MTIKKPRPRTIRTLDRVQHECEVAAEEAYATKYDEEMQKVHLQASRIALFDYAKGEDYGEALRFAYLEAGYRVGSVTATKFHEPGPNGTTIHGCRYALNVDGKLHIDKALDAVLQTYRQAANV